jgi:hypothetical protein
MPSRLGNWAIGLGVIVLFAGLCVLPAAVGKNPSPDLMAFGACLFSMGAVIIAGGIYLKARSIQATSAGGATAQNVGINRKGRGGCDLCGIEAPVVLCKIHQLNLCGTCLGQHYDLRSCIYMPTSRKPQNRPAKSIAKARGA